MKNSPNYREQINKHAQPQFDGIKNRINQSPQMNFKPQEITHSSTIASASGASKFHTPEQNDILRGVNTDFNGKKSFI